MVALDKGCAGVVVRAKDSPIIGALPHRADKDGGDGKLEEVLQESGDSRDWREGIGVQPVQV